MRWIGQTQPRTPTRLLQRTQKFLMQLHKHTYEGGRSRYSCHLPIEGNSNLVWCVVSHSESY